LSKMIGAVLNKSRLDYNLQYTWSCLNCNGMQKTLSIKLKTMNTAMCLTKAAGDN
jgi:hypothetical protein